MKIQETTEYIVDWLINKVGDAGSDGLVLGISGGVDSALTSTICAKTGLKVIAAVLPLHQKQDETERGLKHISWLKEQYPNVESLNIDLTETFETFRCALPSHYESALAMANARARLRMTTLYAIGGNNNLLVCGTGNRIEDFGIGFFTKYGDGGVDLSPIGDLKKSEVYEIAKELKIIPEILNAAPTDGLWADGRTDESQIKATYEEIEWAMDYIGDEKDLNEEQKRVLGIYRKLNKQTAHKVETVPVCVLPISVRTEDRLGMM